MPRSGELGQEGSVQIASFHPAYEFAGSEPDDIANCTNRSPYPTLHLLREASIDRAVAAFPDAAAIYERNIETLRRLGHEGWRRLWTPTRASELVVPATGRSSTRPSRREGPCRRPCALARRRARPRKGRRSRRS